jgi:type 1 fimbriae regulatory protein FimB/type 1 fimbriae regulatory protein FimE
MNTQADPTPRSTQKGKVGRLPNAALRQREYLTTKEVERLMKAARSGRYGHRDATMLLIAYRHGLRGQELCDLEWSQFEFGRNAAVHVNRVKNGKSSVHPLQGDEIRALRAVQKASQGPFVFETERGGPFTRNAVNKQLRNIARRAGFGDNQVHFHMLRHGCGYALANAGHDTRAIQDWMGHKNIQHTVRYTELAPTRFRNFWR